MNVDLPCEGMPVTTVICPGSTLNTPAAFSHPMSAPGCSGEACRVDKAENSRMTAAAEEEKAAQELAAAEGKRKALLEVMAADDEKLRRLDTPAKSIRSMPDQNIIGILASFWPQNFQAFVHPDAPGKFFFELLSRRIVIHGKHDELEAVKQRLRSV